jgi:hypothetical protein
LSGIPSASPPTPPPPPRAPPNKTIGGGSGPGGGGSGWRFGSKPANGLWWRSGSRQKVDLLGLWHRSGSIRCHGTGRSNQERPKNLAPGHSAFGYLLASCRWVSKPHQGAPKKRAGVEGRGGGGSGWLRHWRLGWPVEARLCA